MDLVAGGTLLNKIIMHGTIPHPAANDPIITAMKKKAAISLQSSGQYSLFTTPPSAQLHSENF